MCPLHLAALHGRIQTVKELIKLVIYINRVLKLYSFSCLDVHFPLIVLVLVLLTFYNSNLTVSKLATMYRLQVGSGDCE